MLDQERLLEEVREKGLPPCTGTAWLSRALLSSWLMESLWGRIRGGDSKGDSAGCWYKFPDQSEEMYFKQLK